MPNILTLVCTYKPCQQSFPVLPGTRKNRKYCSTTCARLATRDARYGETLADRFWAKVAVCEHGRTCQDCCWPWQSSKGSSGYGTIYVSEQQRLVGAHVASWFLHTGNWPTDGMEIMHQCPKEAMRACVNFPHLREGTHIENMQDLMASGRYANQFQAVTQATREEIVARYMTGHWTYDSLARKYGLSSQSIYTYVRKHRESTQ